MTEQLSKQTQIFHRMWDDYLGWNGKYREGRERSKEYNRKHKKSGGKQKVTMKPINVGRNVE